MGKIAAHNSDVCSAVHYRNSFPVKDSGLQTSSKTLLFPYNLFSVLLFLDYLL